MRTRGYDLPDVFLVRIVEHAQVNVLLHELVEKELNLLNGVLSAFLGLDKRLERQLHKRVKRQVSHFKI